MNRTQLGLIATAVWFTAALLLFWVAKDGDLKINEIGDYIAGAVAPVAFFWFILGYFQQSEEIKANTTALQTQRDELERQVQAMAEQTAALSRTADTLLEHTRPYVICYFRGEGPVIRAFLENIGTRPAQNVHLTFNPPLKDLSDERINQDTIEHQTFLAPSQKIAAYLNTGTRILKSVDRAELRTKCIAEYTDLDGRRYKESFDIAHHSVRMASAQPASLPYAMKELNERLTDIGKTLAKIDVKIGNTQKG